MTEHIERVRAALPGYDVGAEIGRGGCGVVLAGRHRGLRRPVAIKQIPAQFAHDEQIRRRFVAEARVMAAIDHPHVVRVFDYLEAGDLCLLVMEFLPGGTVSQRFASDGFDFATSVAITLSGAAGLAAAHRHQVLHRDVKPANLMFAAGGAVKLTDFGIAKIVGGDETLITRAGDIVGTPSYIAPEQARGQQLSPATDVYALATMLYQLLSGVLPFPPGDGPLAMLFAHAYDEPIPLSEVAPTVPAVIAEVVMRGLATDPAQRFDTAEAFGIALAAPAASCWGDDWLVPVGIPVIGADTIVAAATGGGSWPARPTRGPNTPIVTPAPGPMPHAPSSRGPSTPAPQPTKTAQPQPIPPTHQPPPETRPTTAPYGTPPQPTPAPPTVAFPGRTDTPPPPATPEPTAARQDTRTPQPQGPTPPNSTPAPHGTVAPHPDPSAAAHPAAGPATPSSAVRDGGATPPPPAVTDSRHGVTPSAAPGSVSAAPGATGRGDRTPPPLGTAATHTNPAAANQAAGPGSKTGAEGTRGTTPSAAAAPDSRHAAPSAAPGSVPPVPGSTGYGDRTPPPMGTPVPQGETNPASMGPQRYPEPGSAGWTPRPGEPVPGTSAPSGARISGYGDHRTIDPQHGPITPPPQRRPDSGPSVSGPEPVGRPGTPQQGVAPGSGAPGGPLPSHRAVQGAGTPDSQQPSGDVPESGVPGHGTPGRHQAHGRVPESGVPGGQQLRGDVPGGGASGGQQASHGVEPGSGMPAGQRPPHGGVPGAGSPGGSQSSWGVGAQSWGPGGQPPASPTVAFPVGRPAAGGSRGPVPSRAPRGRVRPGQTLVDEGVRLVDVEQRDLVPVQDVVTLPSVRVPFAATAVLAAAAAVAAFVGVGAAPSGGSIAPGQVLVAGVDAAAAQPLPLDLSAPIPLRVNGVDADAVSVTVNVLGVPIGGDPVPIQQSPVGPAASAPGPVNQYVLAGALPGKVSLLRNGSEIATRHVEFATAQRSYTTATAVGIALLTLFALSYVESNLRSLRRGRGGFGNTLGLALSAAVLATTLVGLTWILLSHIPTAATLAACAALGAAAGITAAMGARRLGIRHRYLRRARRRAARDTAR